MALTVVRVTFNVENRMQKSKAVITSILMSFVQQTATAGQKSEELWKKYLSEGDRIYKSDKYARSAQWYKKALAEAQARKKNDASVAIILYRLGTISLSGYHHREAKEYFQKCLHILERLPNDKRLDLDIASTLVSLGDVSGSAVKAQIYFERALAIQKKLLHAEDTEFGTTQYKLACALYNLNKYEKALPLYKSAESIFAKHGLTLRTEVEIEMAACCVKLGRYDEALKLERRVAAKLQQGHTLKVFAHTLAHYLYDMVDGYLDHNRPDDAQRSAALARMVVNKYKHEMPDGQLPVLSSIDKLYKGHIPSPAESEQQPQVVVSNMHYMKLLDNARIRQKNKSLTQFL